MTGEPFAEVELASPRPPTRTRTRKRVAIILIAIGAVLVVVGMVGSAVLRHGTSTGTSGDIGVPSESTPVPNSSVSSGSDTPPGSARDLTFLASLSASSTLKGYPVRNVVDGKMNVAWAEGVAGYGRGQWIRFTFPNEVWVSKIRVVPGYLKYDSKHDVDRWYSNGRVASAKLVFSDGTESGEFTFDTDDKGWQVMTLPEPVKTSTVRFVITGIAKAQTGTKHDASDTTISEMRVIGFTP